MCINDRLQICKQAIMKLKIYLALEENSCLFALFKEGKGRTAKNNASRKTFLQPVGKYTA